MKIGFYTYFDRDPINYVLGRGMIKSVKALMPGVPVVQLTDEKSPIIYGVDEVRRLPFEDMCVHTARHYSLCEGEWILVDTDVLFQKDPRALFDGATWDVAVTDRKNTFISGDEEGCKFVENMPYNIGVVFQRNGKKFWEAVIEGLGKLDQPTRQWMGNQVVADRLLKEGGWNVAVIPGYLYNYPPKSREDDLSHAYIVHYKGLARKMMMWNKVSGVCASA